MWYEIFKFELHYRIRRPDTYIYFFILFFFSLVAADIFVDGGSGFVYTDSPYTIAKIMVVISAMSIMVASMIMGTAALRDFDHQMESLMFINPIKKRDYLLGRFLGSFVILTGIFTSLPLGLILGDFMPWREVGHTPIFTLWHYVQPFLFLVLPNLFFAGALFFVGGALSRKLMMVYLQGIFLLIIYMFAIILSRSADNQFLAAILDPFSFQTTTILTQLWTPLERSSQMLPLEGILLYNRLIWIGVGILALIIGYCAFHFNVVRSKASKKKQNFLSGEKNVSFDHSKIVVPSYRVHYGVTTHFLQLGKHALFNFRSILKEAPFWAIVVCGIAIIFMNSINLGTVFGVNSYPATYLVVGELQEMSIYFFLMILIFYSGELLWKERDIRFHQIYDALPLSNFTNIAGKFIGLVLTYVVLLSIILLAGVLFQTLKGYYNYELEVYGIGLFVDILLFLVLYTIVSFLIQVLTNHKFLGHFIVFIFFASTIFMEVMGYNHGLYKFGGDSLGSFSAMNGYGHFMAPFLWFKTYWMSFSILLFIIAIVFSVRGTETHIKKRWHMGRLRFTGFLSKLSYGALFVFILSGAYIFYNTNILNTYSSQSEEEIHRVNYEKNLKQFEHLPQPKITGVHLNVALYPSDRDYTAEGYFILTNPHSTPIEDIHIQKFPNKQVTLTHLNFEGGTVADDTYALYGHHIHRLNRPLLPGDSLKMGFKQTFTTQGFTESMDVNIVYNGTFFDDSHFPTLGYNDNYELRDNAIRKTHGLEPRPRRDKIDDPLALREGIAGDDGEKINFEMVLSTDNDQIAIAPGYLQNEWTEDGRHYFHYKMDKPMSNFYSIVSARYEIMKDVWTPKQGSSGTPVALEIYYHKGHEYNLERMMSGMKKSLDYYSANFGSYQYRQLRILEFPNYRKFAQSFPNTVPFSEGIGFLMDLGDEEEVDMAFYVTAHEVAHQWWGHQVNPANVQGKAMISEALTQYSATMVLQQKYAKEKVRKFLQTQMDRYRNGRATEGGQEMPLTLVEPGQEYIHYGKGAIAMYALQDYVSEDSINKALKRFIKDWGDSHTLENKGRYATTTDVLPYLREVTPDSLQYVIKDMFETVTLYDTKVTKAISEPLTGGKYRVTLEFDLSKYRNDEKGERFYEDIPGTQLSYRSEGAATPLRSLPLADYIDIGIFSEETQGSKEESPLYLKKHKIEAIHNKMTFIVDQEPLRIAIDPFHKLIDTDPVDNGKTF